MARLRSLAVNLLVAIGAILIGHARTHALSQPVRRDADHPSPARQILGWYRLGAIIPNLGGPLLVSTRDSGRLGRLDSDHLTPAGGTQITLRDNMTSPVSRTSRFGRKPFAWPHPATLGGVDLRKTDTGRYRRRTVDPSANPDASSAGQAAASTKLTVPARLNRLATRRPWRGGDGSSSPAQRIVGNGNERTAQR